MPAQVVRVSQRRPRACQECSKRKIKCDKLLPCARCQRLGIECAREVVKIKSNVTQHADEVAFLESITSDLEMLSSQGGLLRAIIERLKERTARLQYGDDTVAAAQPRAQSALAKPATDSEQQRLSNKEIVDLSVLTTLEHLAWGRVSGRCFPHTDCGCQYRAARGLPPYPVLDSSVHILGNFTRIVAVEDARTLINFHLVHLVWHHNCVHAPTFLKQCDVYWETGQCVHPSWYALYLSVLSATIFAIQTSPRSKAIIDVAFSANLPSARDVFSAMIDALWDGKFLQNAALYSVQAIAISTEVAHNLGQSQLNTNLLSTAIRIAESLGLHTIHDTYTNHFDLEASIEREVGKRVWCQLIIQDNFAIPFTDTYVISPAHFSTSPPKNMDDDNLSELPEHLPTVSSYVRVLLQMAALMPGLQDGLGPMKQRKSLHEQYQHVLQVDTQMRSTVRGFPAFLLRPDVQHEALLPWLGTARRSLAITAAEKIIMIHRPFLVRSFQMPQYNFTRRTCTAAARTILSQYEALIEAQDLPIWTHTAFCITATVILCFEIRTSRGTGFSDSTEASAEMHRKAVETAREHLASRQSDVLAQRGVTLIDILLGSPPFEDALTFGVHVIAEFNRITSDALRVPYSEGQPGCQSAFMKMPVFSDEDAVNDMGTLDDSTMDLDIDYMGNEFEEWFNGIFVEY